MRKISARGAEVAIEIASESPFQTHGALSAVLGASGSGKLPEPWKTLYEASREAGTVRYTVLSYDTPIAWTTADGYLFFPEVRYSVTTSAHQGQCYRLVNCYGGLSGKRMVRTLADLEPPDKDKLPPVSPQSGEGALYSLEYLQAKMKTPAS